MGAAAVPLAVSLGTAGVASQLIQSDTMKRQMEKQRKSQSDAVKNLAAQQKKQDELSEATLKRDEARSAQLKNKKGYGRQSTILTSGLESQSEKYGKTILGS